MHKMFEINRTKIKGGYQSGRKVVTHNSKSDLPLTTFEKIYSIIIRANIFQNTLVGPGLLSWARNSAI